MGTPQRHHGESSRLAGALRGDGRGAGLYGLPGQHGGTDGGCQQGRGPEADRGSDQAQQVRLQVDLRVRQAQERDRVPVPPDEEEDQDGGRWAAGWHREGPDPRRHRQPAGPALRQGEGPPLLLPRLPHDRGDDRHPRRRRRRVHLGSVPVREPDQPPPAAEQCGHLLHRLLKSLKAAGSERKFYMCTDEQAVDSLQKALKMEDISLTTAPTRMEPKELLEKLAAPENIGDAHLRYMAKYPEKYNIRPELIKMFFNAFYKVLWNADSAQKSDLKLEVLKGERSKERGFVDIATTKDCVEEGLTPMMNPRVGANPEDGFYLLSLQGVGVYRNQLARFFAGKSHNMIDASTMKSRLNHHGRSHLEMTSKYLAKGLPFYTVYIV